MNDILDTALQHDHWETAYNVLSRLDKVRDWPQPESPFHYAVFRNAPLRLIELIWKKFPKIDINARTDGYGRPPLFDCQTIEVFEFLMKNGADIHLLDKNGLSVMFRYTPDRALTIDDSLKLLVACLRHGLNPNDKSRLGISVLQLLECFQDDANIIRKTKIYRGYNLLKVTIVLMAFVQGKHHRVGQSSPIRLLPIELVKKLKVFLYI